MQRILACALAALLIAALLPGALAMTRQELRAAYSAISAARTDASPYAAEPDLENFSTVGEISAEKQQDALNCLNFLRSIAGLDPVSINPLYTLRSQNAAALLAGNDEISHNPAPIQGMNPDLYHSAQTGAAMGNLAKFNWMHPDILIDGVEYFARDDGEMNLGSMPHRRWLLNPFMAETGFGLANAQSGNSYVVMYAVDGGNADAQWSSVCWPAAGVFPVELMRSNLAWTISLNEALYDIDASSPAVLLEEETSGAQFRFYLDTQVGDGHCALSRESYGAGPCIIFRPDIASAGLDEYQQNQVWTVELSGLVQRDGSESAIRYRCEMVSLYPQDVVNVEMYPLQADMQLGQTIHLSAQAVPSYADDLRLDWHSSDENIATVDFFGNVTAVSPGTCQIIAESVNGRCDFCEIRVAG